MLPLVMDWGIGGLSVYREIKARAPKLGCVYFSDSGSTPYGKMPAEELGQRVSRVISQFEKSHRITHAVVACNAASTVIPQVNAKVPVVGVIESGVELALECSAKMVGVIGGKRTIDSHVFLTRILGKKVLEEVAQPLSALIEAGVLSGNELQGELRKILEPLRRVDALLLACTHYPAISEEIRKILPGAELLDPAARTAEKLCANLKLNSLPDKADEFFTSGDCESSNKAARAAFGVECSFQKAPPC